MGDDRVLLICLVFELNSELDSSCTFMGLFDSWVSSLKLLCAFDFKLMVDFLDIVCVLPNLMLGSSVSYVCESSYHPLDSSFTGIPS